MLNPSQVNRSASPTPIPIAYGGWLVKRIAIAAGVTMRAKMSSTPTTRTASVTAPQPVAQAADGDAAAQCEREQADHRARPCHHRAGGARKTDVRKRVRRK